jgi:putative AlgH/UPF0301 family transcriptional regulator
LELFMLVATPYLHDPFRFFDRNVIVVQKLANGEHRGSTINRDRVERPDMGPCVSIVLAGPQSPKKMKCLLSVVDGQMYYDWQDAESSAPDSDVTFVKERGDVLFFCAGDSGWGAGQLEEEIAGGSWNKVELDPKWITDSDYHTIWERMVRELGGNPEAYGPVEGDGSFVTMEFSESVQEAGQ